MSKKKKMKLRHSELTFEFDVKFDWNRFETGLSFQLFCLRNTPTKTNKQRDTLLRQRVDAFAFSECFLFAFSECFMFNSSLYSQNRVRLESFLFTRPNLI